MGEFKYKLKEEPIKVGDVNVKAGEKFTVKNIDPETGTISWDVEHVPAFDSVFEDFVKLTQSIRGLDVKTDDEVIDDIAIKIKEQFNRYRTHIRNNYPDSYKRFQTNEEEIDEASVTGGTATFTPGTGEQYATPYAFSKKGQKVNSATKYAYKLGYKPAPSIPNRKSKVIDYKKL